MRPRAFVLAVTLVLGAWTIASAQQPSTPPAATAPAAQPSTPAVAPATGAAPAAAPATTPAAPPAAPPPPAFAAPDLGEKGARALAANCAICHGTNGRAVKGSNVRGLAGRPREELVKLLTAYRDGTVPATVMHQLVKGYGDAEIDAMAGYFSKQKR